MKNVKNQTRKGASSARHASKRNSFLFGRYRWVILVGFILVVGVSLFAVHYVIKGKVLALTTGPMGGGCEDYCSGNRYCTVQSINPPCKTTKCSYVSGKCGYTPKPKPKDPRLQSLSCTTKTYPYQIFGPAYLAGGYDSTQTNLFGKITASICTDEIYNSQYKKYVARIRTKITFDKLAINARVSCEGPGSYPISNHDKYNYQTYKPVSHGALAVYYLNGASDPSIPDGRNAVSCPGSNDWAFQFSPDVSIFSNIHANTGDTYQGRLVFTLNFHPYGYTTGVDIWSNKIKVK